MASHPPRRLFVWSTVFFSFLGVVGFAYAQTSPTPAAGVLMYNTTFEGDPWNPPTNWGISQSAGTGSSYSLQTNTPRTGSRALRMTLTRNNASDFRTEISGGGSRVPLSTSLTAPTPVEQWLGYSMRLVAPYPTDTILGETLTQWHNGNTVQGVFQSENNGSEGNWSASPVLSLRQTTDGRLTVENRFSPYSPLDPRRPAEGGQYLRAGLETRHVVGKLSNFEGVWSDWVWHVVWDWRTTGGTGRIELWNRLPGGSWVKQIDYSGPVGVNDYTPTYQGALPYLKMGIYKSQWKFGTSSVSSRSIEFDNIKMYRSGGSFSQVAPSGTPTPPKPTTDTTAPSTPIGISVTAVSPSQVKLSWSTSTDNVGVKGYRLERCKGAGCTTFAQIATVIGTAYTNISLLASTSYTYRVRAVDAAGNLSGYSETSRVTTLSTIFSPAQTFFGNTINWQPLTASRWGVLADGGNARYALKTTAFSPLAGNRLGEYTLVKGKTYADFTFTAKVRTTENLTTNPTADYNVLFGFQDAKNYYYLMVNGKASSSQLFKVVNGTRITLDTATTLAIPDTAYHTLMVERSGSTITVFFDGAEKLETTDTTFMTGRIGIGGYNDAAMWDNIRVTGTVETGTSTPPTTPTSTPSGVGRPAWVGTWGIWGGESYKFPWLKGSVVSCTWAQLESTKGNYDFTCLDNKFSKAIANNQKVMPLIYIDTPPDWVWDSVPKVETNGTSGRFFPYYLDSDYKTYVKALWGAFLKHVASQSSTQRDAVVAQQLAMGKSGDQDNYEGTPLKDEYKISSTEWGAYQKEMVTAWLDARENAGLNIVPLLNVGQGTFDMMENLQEPFMRKDGLRTQFYQQNREMNAESVYGQLSRKIGSDYVRTRGEFDEPVKLDTGWLTAAPVWHYYWNSLWVLTWGIDILNQRTQSLSQASTHEEAFIFFTDHSGYKNPRTAKYAYVALRDGLDIANTSRFPEATYGTLSGINSPTRYQKIATAMAQYGAKQDDVTNQTLGGLESGKTLTGINDVGYLIWQDNYGKYLNQIDPLGTSQGYWRVGSINEPYGRYARGFNTSKGMSRMYFNVDDDMFATGGLAGKEEIKIRVVYYDKGTGTWALNYDSTTKADKQAYTITNGNTNTWKEKIITVSDANLNNLGPKNSDISLVNTDSTDEIFHMVEITFTER